MSITRYQLPATPYFEYLRAGMPLETLAGYAESERRAELYGPNLGTTMYVPLSGPHEYSPYGAGIVERIREFPGRANWLTGRWQRALVAMANTAILGLGSATVTPEEAILAEQGDVIGHGKAKFFLTTTGVPATSLCIRSALTKDQLHQLERMDPALRKEQARIWRALHYADTVRALAPNFGFINIEDAQGKDLPLIFGALECLRGQCAVWSDDKQGTGVIMAAAMLAWADITNRKLENVRFIIFGAGAGAMGVYDELLNHGMLPENILVTDSKGVLYEGRPDIQLDPYKVKMSQGTRAGTTVEEFAAGADGVANLGVKETFTNDLVWTEQITRSLAKDPLFLAMTNPEPGITPSMLHGVRPDAFYGSGNQTFENTVNNFTAFGYIGAGALMAWAGGVGPAMTAAAARGIFEVAKMDPRFGRHWLVPRPSDIRLIENEAAAVARAAAREGLSLKLGPNPTPEQLQRFDQEIARESAFRRAMVQEQRDTAHMRGKKYFEMRYPDRYAPFYLNEDREKEKTPEYHIPPEVDREQFTYLARQMGLKDERWQHFVLEDGRLDPKAFTTVLEQLKTATVGDEDEAKIARTELSLLVQIGLICPALGLALALRRTRMRPENAAIKGPTLFHREAILRVVLREVPEARKAVYASFQGIPDLGRYEVQGK